MKLKDWPKAGSDTAKLVRSLARLSVMRKEEIIKLKRENKKLRAEIARLKALLGEEDEA